MDIQIPVTLVELFKFIGSPVFLAALVSYVLETVPAWANFSATTKRAVVLVLAALLGLLSYALVTAVPGEVITRFEPWYAALAQAVIALIGTQWFHAAFNVKKSTEIIFESAVDDDASG